MAATSFPTAAGSSDESFVKVTKRKPRSACLRAALTSRYDAMFLARGEYALDRRHVLRLFLVEIGLQSEPEREIGRTDVNPVQPGRAGDLVDLLDPLAGLDHDEAQDAVPHDGDIAAVHDHGGPDRAEGAVATWGVAARRHRGGGF